MLLGDYPRLHSMRRMWGALPTGPRCKLCNAPFRGPGGLLMRAIGYGPSSLNRRLCKWCLRAVHRHPGGAEVEITVLFADVRGSTAMAERMTAEEFSRLLDEVAHAVPPEEAARSDVAAHVHVDVDFFARRPADRPRQPTPVQ